MRKEIITKVDPKSPASEVFRSLRTNIQYVNNGRKNQTILITSTAQGEGKSWIAANLATTFAQAGKYVIIVDADMRRPRQNSIFNVQMFPGLSNYLSGVDVNGLYKEIRIKECIRETEVKNLYLIPAGNIPPNPSELLLGEKIIILINELKKVFDVIIFDGAPCLLVTDATIISRIVDSTILVTSQGTTKIDDLKEAKKRIENVGGKIVGVVLNRVKVTNKKYQYGYYYYKDESTNTIVKKKKKIGSNVSSESTLTANKNEEIENILDKINKFNGE